MTISVNTGLTTVPAVKQGGAATLSSLTLSGPINQSNTATFASSGAVSENFFYLAPQPSGAGSGTYTTIYASIQYNSPGDTTQAVSAIKGVAELFDVGGANQCIGVYGIAQSDANGGSYGASQSLYGGHFYTIVQGTRGFNHAIGVKIGNTVCNGNTTYVTGLYVQDQTNTGTGSVTTISAIHVEGSGVSNAIAWGNGTSGVNATLYSSAANVLDCIASSGINFTGPVSASIKSGAYASKPAASNGLLYYATDLGSNGVLIISNGSIWKPATGTATIYYTGVKSTFHTGDTAETNIATITIPAGLVSANGALRLTVHAGATGTTSTKLYNIYFSAVSGGANGTQISSLSMSAANLSAVVQKSIFNRNSVSSQGTSSSGQIGYGTSSGASITPAINTANASYFNITVTLGNAADAAGYDALLLEWIEP